MPSWIITSAPEIRLKELCKNKRAYHLQAFGLASGGMWMLLLYIPYLSAPGYLLLQRTIIWQYLGMASKSPQKPDQERGLHHSASTCYAQNLITILQIKICFILGKTFVYLLNQQAGMTLVFHIGFKNFHHLFTYFSGFIVK
jgi:hypothetical protein